MPVKNRAKLANADNARILDAIRWDGSLDYQRRIPEATQGGVKKVLESLIQFKPQWNEFEGAFINRIGTVLARNSSWDNPLAVFKKGLMTYGETVEEYFVGLLSAHTYDGRREYMEGQIFGTEKPRVESNFHTMNRKEYYRVTTNQQQLQAAFLEEGGLTDYISRVLNSPTTSDNWDEFLLMTGLLRDYHALNGYFKVQVPDVSKADSSAADAKAALRIVRATVETLKTMSTRYNAAHMPMAASPDELVLITTPEFIAAIDVEALAFAFNVDRMTLPTRIITVPEEHFGIKGAQAILTTEDFFVVLDNMLETTSIFNPVSMGTNYFLHHWQTISASRFVPAILFTTEPGTDVVKVTPKITSIDTLTVYDVSESAVSEVAPGFTYEMKIAMTVNPPDPDNFYRLGVSWFVEGANSSKTTVDRNGNLVIGGDETSTEITVIAVDAAYDRDAPTAPRKTKTLPVTVAGQKVPEWPNK